MSLFSCVFQSKEQRFWSWFVKYSDQLMLIKKGNEPIADELAYQLKLINKYLTFEVSTKLINGKKEFIISADGILSAFDSVTKLYDTRPQLVNWEIKKFRQRKNSKDFILKYESIIYDANETKYILIKDDNPKKVAIILFTKNYSESMEKEYRGAALLFLDAILGEYDIETKIGTVDVYGSDSEYYAQSKDIGELINDIDQIFHK